MNLSWPLVCALTARASAVSLLLLACGSAPTPALNSTTTEHEPAGAIESERNKAPALFIAESNADTDAGAFVIERSNWFGLIVGFGPGDESEARATETAHAAFAASKTALEGFRLANEHLHAQIGGPNSRGLGTGGASAATIAFVGDTVEIHHVGSVRVYRWRDDVLTSLTVDHSLLEDYIRINKPDPVAESELRRNAPHRTVVVRALGPHEMVEVETHTHDLRGGDEYWLVSGAIPYALDDAQITDLVRSASVGELVARASHPERTAVVLRVRVPSN